MSKCMLAVLLKNEAQNLNRLIHSLEDRSKLCYPNEYNYSECLREVISNLRRIGRRAQREFSYQNEREWKESLTQRL